MTTGFEDLPTFEEAIAAEPARLADLDETRFADPRYEHYSYEHHSYLARGRYVEQLARWQRVFAPTSCSSSSSSECAPSREALLERCSSSSACPPCEPIDLRPRNERKSQPPMTKAT